MEEEYKQKFSNNDDDFAQDENLVEVDGDSGMAVIKVLSEDTIN